VVAAASTGPYAALVIGGLAVGVALCVAARRHPGPWRVTAARVIGTILAVDAGVWLVNVLAARDWAAASSLPLALCNVSVLVAAAACWWRRPLLVELTWFWGMAASLQAVLTPDVTSPFPQLDFFQYAVGHVAIVVAAAFLVIGMGIEPRRGAVVRVLAITAAYTALVGVVDDLTDANYMFLRAKPSTPSLLDLFGPWPWYLLGAIGVAVILVLLLDLPFWLKRRRAGPRETAPPRTAVRRSSGGAELTEPEQLWPGDP
jgi:hypothetical integral membrane protein (TIGR02206 family)